MIKKTLANRMKALWTDESAQGSTEYILLLVVVVAIAILFKGKIKEMVGGKLDELNAGMGQVKVDN